MRRQSKRWLTAIMLATAPVGVLSLGGCDLPSNAVQEPIDATLPYDQSSKLGAYYRMINGFDLPALRHRYEEMHASKAKAGDSLFIEEAQLEGGLSDLQRVRAMDGALGDVDAAADRFLRPLQQATNRAKGLDSYFTTRGYLTDGYARAKREDPMMLADYDAALAAYTPFAAAVEQATAKAEAVTLEGMRREGRSDGYYDILIVQKVRAIRAATTTSTALDDGATAARADQLVADLIPLLERDRAARAASMAKVPADERSMLDDGLISSVEQVIGTYREYRRTKGAGDYERFRDTTSGLLLSVN